MIQYRPIPSCPGYFAGEDGSIIGRRGKPLRQKPAGRDGYRVFRMPRTDMAALTVSSHVAICEAWHGPRPDGHQVAHENGDGSDNRVVNLSWKTPQKNNWDKWRHGTQQHGLGIYWNVKLTPEIVREIRGSDETNAALAKRYGVSDVCIHKARVRKSWRHVQ